MRGDERKTRSGRAEHKAHHAPALQPPPPGLPARVAPPWPYPPGAHPPTGSPADSGCQGSQLAARRGERALAWFQSEG